MHQIDPYFRKNLVAYEKKKRIKERRKELVRSLFTKNMS